MHRLSQLALETSPRHFDPATNRRALASVPRVVASGADLLRFASFAGRVRGWGRGLRSAIGGWYLSRSVSQVAREVLNPRRLYRWSHRDLVRLAHPEPDCPSRAALFRWLVDGELTPGFEDLRVIRAFERAQDATDIHEIVRLIEDNRLVPAMIPDRWLTSGEVWEALIVGMNYTDLVRNLARMSAAGVLRSGNTAAALVVARLADRRAAERAGLEPAAILKARDASLKSGAPRSVILALEEVARL